MYFGAVCPGLAESLDDYRRHRQLYRLLAEIYSLQRGTAAVRVDTK